MSNITSNSLAAAIAASAKNVQFQPTAEVIPSKILIIGTGNPATEAANPTDTPVQIFSPEDVASKTGSGYMLHRLALSVYEGSKGIETWMIQQPENVAAAAAVGEIDFAAAGVLAGTWHLYIGGDYVPVTITDGMTKEDIADAIVSAVSLDDNLPITAAKVAVTFEVTVTVKTQGTYGNEIKITQNLEPGQVTPTGIGSVVITQPTAGSGIPDIQDALDSLGTGDGSNEAHFTDVIHGYLQDSTTLNAIRDYVGAGNTSIGLWDKVVHRPFVAYTGDTVDGSAGLSALIALGDGRKTDRANSLVVVPDSPNHASEIAAQTCGIVARVANDRPEKNYIDQVLSGVYPGDKGSDRWTSEYNNRDTAVKAGISPTIVKSGAVYLQNVVTFYHPDDVPQTSNGYRSVRNIKIISNIVDNVASNFEQERWKGISIVSDTARVSNPAAKLKARDVVAVRNDLVALARSFEENAWLYSADFTIEKLREAGAISVRVGGDGFDSNFKIVLSGEGNILDAQIQFDTSIAVFL